MFITQVRGGADLRHDQRNVGLHAKGWAIVDNDCAAFEQRRDVTLARILAARKEDHLEAAQGFIRSACTSRSLREIAPVWSAQGEANGLSATGPADRVPPTAAQSSHRLHTGHADDRDVHCRSSPTERPRVRSTAKTAASMPPTKESRLSESWRQEQLAGPPKSTSLVSEKAWEPRRCESAVFAGVLDAKRGLLAALDGHPSAACSSMISA